MTRLSTDESNKESTPLTWRNLLPWMGLALFASQLPYLIGWLTSPAGWVFSGILANHNDFSAYIAAMRQGAEGNWLFHFNFSPEYWQPKLMLPLYMTAGKVIGPFSHAFVFWFNVLRSLAFLVTLLALYGWVRQVLPANGRTRLTAWLLIVFGGGLSWAIWPATAAWGVPFAYFPDISMPEFSTLLVAINPPHYMLGLGLEVLLFICVLRLAESGNKLKWAIAGAAAAFGLGLVYVYHSAVVGAVIGVYLLVLAWQAGKIPWRTWLYGGVIVAPLVPLLFYYGYWVNRDPAWASYVNSGLNEISPPPLLGLVIGFGLMGLLAVIGLRRWLKSGQTLFVPIWLVVNLILMYVPVVQYSGRFTLGLIVPVGTLAAYGLEAVLLPWLRERPFYQRFGQLTPTPYDSLRRVFLLLTMPAALMVILFLAQNVTLIKDFPNYLPDEELEAAQWLAENSTEGDVVLAYYPIGNYLPSVADSRVFAGQFFLTLDFENKTTQVEQFWDEGTADSWRDSFLQEWGITYIYEGRYEQQIRQGSVQPPGDIVYEAGGVKIYRVR
jgi:hypothetical protein